jgi:hypothetical protein
VIWHPEFVEPQRFNQLGVLDYPLEGWHWSYHDPKSEFRSAIFHGDFLLFIVYNLLWLETTSMPEHGRSEDVSVAG